jgi:hypothetical protein
MCATRIGSGITPRIVVSFIISFALSIDKPLHLTKIGL